MFVQRPRVTKLNFDLPVVVQTDASELGLGAVVLQDEGDYRRPVQYISRKLFPRQTKYSTIEKEALTIKWALATLKYYLIGKDFVLETDHSALQWLRRIRDTNVRITQWYLSLQPNLTSSTKRLMLWLTFCHVTPEVVTVLEGGGGVMINMAINT